MHLIQKLLFLSCLVSSAVMANNSPEVEALFSKHIEAVGGELALNQMQSLSRHGQLTRYAAGDPLDTFCYRTDNVYPNKLRQQIKGETDIALDHGTDGQSFWKWNGIEYDFRDAQLSNYMRMLAERDHREVLWDKASNFEMMPTPPSWAPHNSQCINSKQESSISNIILCFDKTTGLMNAKAASRGYQIQSDWRSVGNVKIPFNITNYMGGFKIFEIQLDHADLNQVIDEAQFIKPLAPQNSCN